MEAVQRSLEGYEYASFHVKLDLSASHVLRAYLLEVEPVDASGIAEDMVRRLVLQVLPSIKPTQVKESSSVRCVLFVSTFFPS